MQKVEQTIKSFSTIQSNILNQCFILACLLNLSDHLVDCLLGEMLPLPGDEIPLPTGDTSLMPLYTIVF